ncbi:MAG: 50S ribosomal protein L21 [Candidatus Omnitrophica bacterium]|nr:50S ribosomal protein L21 [Candidatus Omnitrophota bacterium]
MYAIIDLQGTQVRVEKGEKFLVNRIKALKDKKIKVENVLFGKKGSAYVVGDPYIKGAYIECDVLGETRGEKLIAFKYKRRKSTQSKKGHRQELTELKVKDIHLP